MITLKGFFLSPPQNQVQSSQSLNLTRAEIDENVPPPPTRITLSCLSDVPQAWLGTGTWDIPSLLLVSLCVILVTTLVRLLLTRPRCSPPVTPRPSPHLVSFDLQTRCCGQG